MARRSGPGRIDSSTGFATWVSCKNRGWERKPPGTARPSRVNPKAAAIAAEPGDRTRSESEPRMKALSGRLNRPARFAAAIVAFLLAALDAGHPACRAGAGEAGFVRVGKGGRDFVLSGSDAVFRSTFSQRQLLRWRRSAPR